MKKPDIEAIKTLDPNAVFSVGEVAKLLGKSHNGILMQIKRNRIKYGKCGSRYFIPGSEIQKQLQLPEDLAEL